MMRMGRDDDALSGFQQIGLVINYDFRLPINDLNEGIKGRHLARQYLTGIKRNCIHTARGSANNSFDHYSIGDIIQHFAQNERF